MALANAWSSHDFLCHHLSLDEPFGLDGEALESFGISDSFGSAMAPSASSDAALGGFEGASGGGGWFHSASSFLNFERGNYYNLGPDQEDCDAWIDAMDQNYQMNHLDMKPSTAESNWLIEDQSYAELVSAFGSSGSPVKGKRCQNGAEVEILQGTIAQVKGQQKRPCMDGNMPSPKKRCGANRTLKEKQSPSKDLQSIAAKNRRERISERLKILQDLVPNGTKVDLVTMLEKAINYVKFLQLQVKVLATDEFWPAQGEKAPDLAQVKEAIDAILSSHKDRQL